MKKIVVLLVITFCIVACTNAQVVKLIPNPDTSAVGFDGYNAIEYNGSLYAIYLNKFGKRQLAKYTNKIITLINNPDTGSITKDTKFTVYNNKLYFVYDSKGFEFISYSSQYASYDGSSIKLISNPTHCSFYNAFNQDKDIVYKNKMYIHFQLDSTGEYIVAKYDGNNYTIISQNLGVNVAWGSIPFIFKNKLCFTGTTKSGSNVALIAAYNDTSFTISDTLHSITNVVSSSNNVIEYNNNAYSIVQVITATGYGYVLAKYDGNQLTRILIDSTSNNNYSGEMQIFNNKLYFGRYIYSPSNSKTNLMQYDGTSVLAINNIDTGQGVNYYNMCIYKSKLFFTYTNVKNKTYLANYNGTSINLIPNLDTASQGVRGVILLNNKIYFPYYTTSTQINVGRYNDTTLILYQNPDTLGELLDWGVAFDSTVYFSYRNLQGKIQIAYLKDSIVPTPCYPAISIAVSTSSICYGTKITFTATATNTGTAPIYQWKKNNANVGANSNVYVDSTLNVNDSVVCVLTNTTCSMPTTVGSNFYVVKTSVARAYTYMANEDSTLSIVDLTNMSVVDTFHLSINPDLISVSPNNDKVIIANINGDSKINVLNTLNNTITSIPLKTNGTRNICFEKTGQYFYYADSTTLKKVDANTYTIISQTSLGLDNKAYDIWLTKDNAEILVVNSNDTLCVFNAQTLARKNSLYLKDYSLGFDVPIAVVSNSNNSKIYIGSAGLALPNIYKGNVVVVNRTSNTIEARIPVGIFPNTILIDSTHNKLFVACDSTKNIYVINTLTNSVITIISTSTKPYAISMSSDATKVYVACVGSLMVVDALTNTIIQNTIVNKAARFKGNFIAQYGTPCTTSNVYNIAGNIKTPLKKAVKNVNIKLTGNANSAIINDNLGNYNFTVNDGNYTLRLTKNNDITKANGVKSVDVILVQRHILNQNKLNNAYKIIAADVNGDKNINSVDVIRIKRLILGSDTTFSKGAGAAKVDRLWEFVDSSYVFADTTNPFPFKDSVAFTNLTSNKINQTFIGVKLGDVNYDWDNTIAKLSTVNNVQFTVNSEWRNNQTLNLQLQTSNFKNITAMQYTLHFDNTKYEFIAIENNKLNIDFNTAQANKTGNISMLWTDKNAQPKTLEDGSELFTLVLRKVHSPSTNNEQWTTNDELSLNNSITDIEAWDNDFNSHNIILTKQKSKNQPPATSNELIVFPNPSKGIVNIKCVGAKQVVVIDLLGKIVYNQPINIASKTFNIKLQKSIYIVQTTMQNGSIKNEKLIVE